MSLRGELASICVILIEVVHLSYQQVGKYKLLLVKYNLATQQFFGDALMKD